MCPQKVPHLNIKVILNVLTGCWGQPNSLTRGKLVSISENIEILKWTWEIKLGIYYYKMMGALKIIYVNKLIKQF